MADDKCNTYLNDIEDYSSSSYLLLLQPTDEMPQLEESEGVSKEDGRTEPIRLSNVSVEVESNRTKGLLLGEIVAEQTDGGKLNELVENVGIENQNSDVSNLNLERNQQVSPCERTISTPDMVELNSTSTKRKRKKSTLKSGNKDDKHCNCKKSECLKLYCECFSSEVYCGKDCGCKDCANTIEYADTVYLEKQRILSKDAFAFTSKVLQQTSDSPKRVTVEENETTPSLVRHRKGCNCKKSMCQKKYCECFQAGVGCTTACHCTSCGNPKGTRAEAITNNRAQGNIGVEKTDAQGLSPGPSSYIQHPNNFSTTYASSFSSLNDHTLEALTSNLTDRNGCPEASFAPFPSSISKSLLPWSHHSAGIPSLQPSSLQPCESMASSSNSLLNEMMTENEMLNHNNPTLTTALVATPTNSQQLVSLPYTNSNTLEALTLNLTNRNGCSEAPLAPFPSIVIPSPQPCESMVSYQPSYHDNLIHQLLARDLRLIDTTTPTTTLRATSMNQRSMSMSYIQQGLSSNSWSNLRGSQQFIGQTMPTLISQIMPTLTSLFPNMNSNGNSSQNRGDRNDSQS